MRERGSDSVMSNRPDESPQVDDDAELRAQSSLAGELNDKPSDTASLLECRLADDIVNELADEIVEAASHIGCTGGQLYDFIQRYAEASAQGLMRRLIYRDELLMREIQLSIESQR